MRRRTWRPCASAPLPRTGRAWCSATQAWQKPQGSGVGIDRTSEAFAYSSAIFLVDSHPRADAHPGRAARHLAVLLTLHWGVRPSPFVQALRVARSAVELLAGAAEGDETSRGWL